MIYSTTFQKSVPLICSILFLGAMVIQSCQDEEMISDSCTTPATLRNLTTLDGCGYVFELEDGTLLEPVRRLYCGTPPLPREVTEDPLYNFIFEDGKKVTINYTAAEGVSTCMAGQLVKITCIQAAVKHHETGAR
jgi:hypothetical protein